MEKYLFEMFSLAKQAALNAYVPLCKFPVGACIRTNDAQLFNGCNWENMATPLSQCAEASALSAMLTAGYRKITEVVLVTNAQSPCSPCGACRQRLIQFSDDKTMFYSYNMDGALLDTVKLFEFLPKAFVWKHDQL